MPSRNKNEDAQDPILTDEAGQKALKQIEAELEAAGEAQARRNKFPKDAFVKRAEPSR